MGRRALTAILLVIALGACSRPIQTARTSHAQAPSAAELAAAERQRARRCSPSWGLLLPGLGQLCLGKDAEAATLLSLGVAEAGTVYAVSRRQPVDHPGVSIPLLALQDTWVYALSDVSIDSALARRALYAPTDSLADLAAAPFNIQVLRRADVWAGTLACLAVGVGATLILRGSIRFPDAGADPDVFGYQLDRRIGYPVGIATSAGLFGHVAIAEEALFRGVLHSGIARRSGEGAGLVWGSLIFGLSHSLNALGLPEQDRKPYLLYAIPVITALGAYHGWVYQRSGYSLSVPVAIHFWYDLLLSTTFFLLEPRHSPLSASIAIPF